MYDKRIHILYIYICIRAKTAYYVCTAVVIRVYLVDRYRGDGKKNRHEYIIITIIITRLTTFGRRKCITRYIVSRCACSARKCKFYRVDFRTGRRNIIVRWNFGQIANVNAQGLDRSGFSRVYYRYNAHLYITCICFDISERLISWCALSP